ncbi:MAG: WHG domain-containing protein, partial [Pseudomonadales bacterium]|nr:WHG domain-containing protein [Pseudomonadales bacterium]
HHFFGNHSLLCAIVEYGFIRQRKQLQAVMSGSEELAPKVLLQNYIRAYIDFAVQNPAYYGLMFGQEIWKTAGANDQLTDVAKRAFKNYVHTITLWQEQGIVAKSADPLRFAQVSWGTLHGLSRLMIDGIYIEQLPQEDTIDTVVAMFMP